MDISEEVSKKRPTRELRLLYDVHSRNQQNNTRATSENLFSQVTICQPESWTRIR
jgi:hypothetical protein